MSLNRKSKSQGFSLIELLVVISILAVLAALLFPVFLTARGKAREVSCVSNLRQIGLSIAMYNQDNDGHYPYAIDPSDRFSTPSIWVSRPDFQAQLPNIRMLQDVLQPYTQSEAIFRCPSDFGFMTLDFGGALSASPSSYEQFGTSYYYRTELAASRASESSVTTPAQINVLSDPVGQWHGTLFPLMQRYNILFADGHVKNKNHEQFADIWTTPLANG